MGCPSKLISSRGGNILGISNPVELPQILSPNFIFVNKVYLNAFKYNYFSKLKDYGHFPGCCRSAQSRAFQNVNPVKRAKEIPQLADI